MSGDEIAIKVNGLSKCYHIYDKPHDRLKQSIYPPLQRFVGKPAKRYCREFWALKNVSFEIKKGETVGIIGRNGSGKSTLLQMICGTLAPTSGTVQTNGRIAALLELGSGFNPEFTGRENVYMNGAILGLSQDEIDARFEDVAAFADIGEFIEQPVKTYSSGMFVRLAFASNIMAKPEIMIVDEALAVGDMNFQAKCMTALTRIQERGATVLFVSHDIGALKSLCSRGIFLERGSMEAIGKAPEVAEKYIKVMREEMNADLPAAMTLEGVKAEASIPLENQRIGGGREFKVSREFEARVAYCRYGDGGAKITCAELLDEKLHPIKDVSFNQCVFVRVYFETSVDREVSCNYYVQDEKKILILGAGLRQVDYPLMPVKIGGRYVVTYKTRLPLHEGQYSIQLQISTPVVLGQTARFLDVIDDAIVFRMSRREGARIWTKVYVANEVEVKSCFQN
jgi:lipopolysaccharide transport system ATP-binding protein